MTALQHLRELERFAGGRTCSGNFVRYEYVQNLNTGEHVPKHIIYGGAGKNAHALVEFVFQWRSDAWKRYIDETRNDLRQRIAEIRAYVGSNLDNGIPSSGSTPSSAPSDIRKVQ